MLRKFRPRVTYANVVSSLALFLVVAGGGAVAASNLARNSVSSAQVKDGGILPRDLGFALTAVDGVARAAQVPVDGQFHTVSLLAESVKPGRPWPPWSLPRRRHALVIDGLVMLDSSEVERSDGCRVATRVVVIGDDGSAALTANGPAGLVDQSGDSVSMVDAFFAPSSQQRRRPIRSIELQAQVTAAPGTCRAQSISISDRKLEVLALPT